MRSEKPSTTLIVFCLAWLAATAAWAAREAVVVVPKAVVWADPQRSSPLGYVRQGRVLRVGDEARHKRQVVPVVVSGRIGYVAVEDLDFRGAGQSQGRFHRFKDATLERYGDEIMLGYSTWRPSPDWGSGVDLKGLALKGEMRLEEPRRGFGILLEHAAWESGGEGAFRLFQLGAGATWALVDQKNFRVKAEAWALLAPWAQYHMGGLFTTNGTGAGGMGQLSTVFHPGGRHWGVEVSAGYKLMRFFGFSAPAPYNTMDTELNDMVGGLRLSLGVVYRF